MNTEPTRAIIKRTTKFPDGPAHWCMKVQPELDLRVVRQCKRLRVSRSDFVRCAVEDKLKGGGNL